MVGGLRGWTTASYHTCPVLHQYAQIIHVCVALIQNKHEQTALRRNNKTTHHSVTLRKVTKVPLAYNKCIMVYGCDRAVKGELNEDIS